MRIGTLYSYRTTENAAIRDTGEGLFHYRIDIPERITLDTHYLTTLLQGSMAFTDKPIIRFPGTFDADVNNINIVEIRGTQATIESTSIKVTYSVPDRFIFCMSRAPEDSPSPITGYDDQWSISEANATKFAQLVASNIYRSATLSTLAGLSGASFGDISDLQVSWSHGPVAYEDQSIQITKDAIPSIQNFHNQLFNVAMRKAPSFAAEREYRFAFEFQLNGRLFPPVVDHLMLDLSVLAKL